MHKVSAADLASTSDQAIAAQNMIKLLVLDIDGTISGESNTLSPAVKQAIAAVQDQGIQVAIATGRMYCSALRFHQEINSVLPLAAYQGAWIQDPANQKIHRHWAVSKDIAHQLLDYFEQPHLRALLSVHFYINDQLYVRDLTKESQIYAERSGITPIPVGDLRRVLTNEPTKILALCEDTELIKQLFGDLRRQYTPAELYLTTSVATFFEATNPLVNKGTAVRYIAEELLGLQSSNVMAIGDNFNDLEMLEYAGIGVAMGNAPPGVQAMAQWVAPTVEKDGVATAIEKFLLSSEYFHPL
ncbi:Cof-type HAD-IIB family hydrolase [Umezakia ovalisporum]|jgi:Cof subfamily protein (haloacid dehalogenase superfamily)|uniref:Cof-type HAD-IIB family hydrolase n=1 Tax=Umezakia ovalisporum TaxID=75695 RepID=UPI002475C07D|nr:Cof-type HAD-IIB family hydrolase [Umezakia ovalisporum]MBI1240088.1 Cof-type HAD-IIB family hydrolase [Nostoc sp. RI_552]MDH6085653.1 Cof-type HAD-IIB family hydrolase [Umezakia ovalisporum TAC611]MDH6087392.1 Cof-type HAD-IIB family hydrolase [Umezakia ovalisporum Ak1311]